MFTFVSARWWRDMVQLRCWQEAAHFGSGFFYKATIQSCQGPTNSAGPWHTESSPQTTNTTLPWSMATAIQPLKALRLTSGISYFSGNRRGGTFTSFSEVSWKLYRFFIQNACKIDQKLSFFNFKLLPQRKLHRVAALRRGQRVRIDGWHSRAAGSLGQ